MRKKNGGFDPEEEAEYIAMATKVNADHAKARAKAEAHAAKKREQERAKAARHEKAGAAAEGEEETSSKSKDKGKKRARDEDDGYTSGSDISGVQTTSTPKRPKTAEAHTKQALREDVQFVVPLVSPIILKLTLFSVSGRVTNGFKEPILSFQAPSQAGPSTSWIAGAPQGYPKAVPGANDSAPSGRLAPNKVVPVESAADDNHYLHSSSTIPAMTPESSAVTQTTACPTGKRANTHSSSPVPSGSSGDEGACAFKPMPKQRTGSLSRTRCVGSDRDVRCSRANHADVFSPFHIGRALR